MQESRSDDLNPLKINLVMNLSGSENAAKLLSKKPETDFQCRSNSVEGTNDRVTNDNEPRDHDNGASRHPTDRTATTHAAISRVRESVGDSTWEAATLFLLPAC
ncbi:hypothetical protein J6590_048932 [Homalodisca vitripennis]|nr:hypothetical protein J6590_048932 [Homalodisca vitripennis]